MKIGFLFARQRSGTGALGSFLDKHPQIAYLGEVFHPDNVDTDPWNYFRFLRDAEISRQDLVQPGAQPKLFARYADLLRTQFGDKVVVLDVKYRSLHHVQQDWKGLFEPPWMIAEARRTDAPVIHLKRDNLLETFVSGELADLNQLWHTADEKRIRRTTCPVDIGRMSSYLVAMEREVVQVSDWLDGMGRAVTFDYAEMIDAEGRVAEEIAARIAAAFEIGPFGDRSPGFVKQAPAQVKDAIENFPLVEKALSGTQYAWMLRNRANPAAPRASAPPARPSGAETAPRTRLHSPAVEMSGASALVAERNARALAAIADFRSERDGARPRIDRHFHKYKNAFPYFGYIDCDVGGAAFPMFSGNDDLIAMHFFWLGPKSYEIGSMKLWVEAARTSRCVLDVGAFSGIYALSAARVAPQARVHAVEPVRRTHSRLLLNIYTNGLQNRISAHCTAVSDAEGAATIHQFRGENILGNGASLVEKAGQSVESSEQVSVETVDGLCARLGIAPDLIKFDVEQLEREVLAGAAQTLKACTPRLLIEVTPATALDVAGMLDVPMERVLVVDDEEGGCRPLTPEGVQGVCNLWVDTRL